MPKAINGWKICSKCREEKLVSEFSKSASKADGLCYYCKVCRAGVDKAQYEANREKRLPPKVISGWKVCSKCLERQPVSAFYRSSFSADGLQHYCKECHRHRQQSAESKAAGQRYYEANREKLLAQQVEYRATEAGQATQQRSWLSNAHKQANRRRRARKAGCIGSHTRVEFLALCKRYDWRCLACGKQFLFIFDGELTEDHIEPIGPGVSDCIDNIQPLCGPCNSEKGRKTIDYRPVEALEWLQRLEAKRRAEKWLRK